MTSSHITKTFANLENFSTAHFLRNSLASDIDLSLPALSIKRDIMKIFCNHFLTNFHLDNPPVYFSPFAGKSNIHNKLLHVPFRHHHFNGVCSHFHGSFLLNGFHC